ncbi:MAG: glutathione S-transferase family protein [Rhizomicrobium sp.]|jgi:glutathione S-transferase
MIVLYGFGPAFGLPDPSPFVMKSEVQLKMAGVPYRFERGAPPTAPKGKIPYIQEGEERLGDSTFIRARIEKQNGFDFDKGLSAEQRAQAWAIERMLEDHLYFALIHARWLDDENFAKGPAHFFDGVPAEAREAARAQARDRVRQNLIAHGLGRHSDDEIVGLGARSLAALSTLLGNKAYLFGDAACGADATAFAMTASILTPFFEAPLRRRAESHGNLTAYCDRMMEQHFPKASNRAA